jgi:hypothetical protein
MKKSLNFRVFIISVLSAIIIIIALLSPFKTAHANSAVYSYNGTSANGAIVLNKDCPVTVEEENLTFDISQFPDNNYSSSDDFLNYSGKVTAEYHLYNPSEYDVNLTLAFPFGGYPEYCYAEYDDETGSFKYADNSAQYDITLNGVAAEKTLRHTFYDGYFNLNEQLARLRDDYVSDGLFTPQTLVTEYKYKVTSSANDYVYAVAEVDLSENFAYISAFGYRNYDSENSIILNRYVKNEGEFSVYVLGENSTAPQFKLYKDYNSFADGIELTACTCTMYESKTSTFKELATTYKPQGTISEIDWYNAVVDCLTYYSSNTHFYYAQYLDVSSRLMSWYMYNISISAGDRAVNVVNAPLYPTINTDYTPQKYSYEYLLSPASGWADFANLNIKINTSYYLLSSNLQGFEKVEGGYSLHSDTLPKEDLQFVMSSSETPQKILSSYNIAINVICDIILAIIILFIIKLVVAVVLLVVYAVKK